MKICATPFINPCYYGTDIPSRENLIAFKMSQKEICKFLNADSISYLSIEGLQEIMPKYSCNGFCSECFSKKTKI